MIKWIAKKIAEHYKGCADVDELKRGVKLAMALTEKDVPWREGDFEAIFCEVLYQLGKED